MDPLQWTGTVRMRVQTAFKSITIFHVTDMTPVGQFKLCEVKSYVFNKQIHY